MLQVKGYTEALQEGLVYPFISNMLADAEKFNTNQQYYFTLIKALESNTNESDAAIVNTLNVYKLQLDAADSSLAGNIVALNNSLSLQVANLQSVDTALASQIASVQEITNSTNIMPIEAGVSNIGSSTQKFAAIYAEELYTNGTPVISSSTETVQISAGNNQNIHVNTIGVGAVVLGSQSTTTVETNGQTADILIQTIGADSRVRISSTTEVITTAPSTKIEGNQTVTGDFTVNGNFSALGSVTSVNTTDMAIKDNIIILNKDELGSGVTAGISGIQIDRGNLTDVRFIFDESIDKFKVGMVGAEEALATETFVNNGLVAKAELSHTHYISDINNLQASLDSKLNATANAVSASKLATARNIETTGDVVFSTSFDGSSNSSAVAILANSGVTAGTYQKVTVDAKGRVTNGTTLSASDIPSLDASKITSGTLTVSTSGNAGTATKLGTARIISITGDITWDSPSFDGSGNVTAVATLASSGVTAGNYSKVTVDAKGRVTSGTNPTTLAGYGITDAATSVQLSTLQAQVNAIDSDAINATLKTTSFTAISGEEYIVVANAITITLPASPTTGMQVRLLDGTASLTSVILSGNGTNIEGNSTFTIDTPAFQIRAVYVDVTNGWRIFGF